MTAVTAREAETTGTGPNGGYAIELRNVEKRWANKAIALKSINLGIHDKELLVLVGPSGCGKTTTLNILAGLETPTGGELLFGGKMVNNLPPEERDIAMVFQSIALYPHMNVQDNIVFALKLRKVPANVIRERVEEITRLLGIDQYLKRKLHELSGGERQRVAIAKALVKRPSLFLLDEPFSNLDADMRRQLRSELVRIHRALETTMVFVTHDQEEAMSVADRIAVMNKGDLVQLGRPLDVYHRPVNSWVSRFIGTHPINTMTLTVDPSSPQGRIFDGAGPAVRVEPQTYARLRQATTALQVQIGVRPEFVSLSNLESAGGDALRGEIFTRQVLGTTILYDLRVNDHHLLCLSSSSDRQFDVGASVAVAFDWPRTFFFDLEGGQRILD